MEPRVRAAAAASLSGLAIDPDLVVFFAEDRAEVAAPLLRSARLGIDDWLHALPRLGPTARALLRHRHDLPRDVRRALEAFGPSDLVLGRRDETGADAPDRASASSPILELVERIEAYQRQRNEPAPAAGDTAPTEERAATPAAFQWETGAEGVIQWVDGTTPRGALIGLSIATPAAGAPSGADAATASAFGKRAPFRDARLKMAHAGETGDDWRASGVPFFDPVHGGFLGYRGAARRVALGERPLAEAALFGPALPPDALRQLVHELRTPLNAIMGFAELIEGQFMGPAAEAYRGRAATILDQASGLLATVDDLDTAARIETRRLAETGGRSDIAALLERLRPSFESAARQRGARLALTIAADPPDAAVAPDVAERLFTRLLAATIGLARDGERIEARLDRDDAGGRDVIRLTLSRPAAGGRARRDRIARSELHAGRGLASGTGARPRLRVAADPQPRRGGRRRPHDNDRPSPARASRRRGRLTARGAGAAAALPLIAGRRGTGL